MLFKCSGIFNNAMRRGIGGYTYLCPLFPCVHFGHGGGVPGSRLRGYLLGIPRSALGLYTVPLWNKVHLLTRQDGDGRQPSLHGVVSSGDVQRGTVGVHPEHPGHLEHLGHPAPGHPEPRGTRKDVKSRVYVPTHHTHFRESKIGKSEIENRRKTRRCRRRPV